ANHTGSNDSKDFSINKAASKTTGSYNRSPFTYTGSGHGCSASWATTSSDSGGGPVSPVTYTGRNGTTYAASTTPPSDAGDYTASATFTGDANHTGSNGSKDFSINKAASKTT